MIDKEEYIADSKTYYDSRFGKEEKGKELNHEELERLVQISSAIEILGKDPSEINILDFGCGRGWLANELKAYGKVYGIDLSDEAVAGAAELYPEVRFAVADLSDKKIDQVFPDVIFDILISSEVIEHVLDQDGYLRNAFEALKTGGHLILTTPNGRFKSEYFDGPRKDWGQPYEFWLNRDDLISKCQKAGFKIFSHRTFNPRWLMNLRIYRWNVLKLFENRIIRSMRYRFNINEAFLKLLRKFNLGLYQILIAQKPT